MFGGHTRFRELLGNSLEGIANNVLALRLAKLTDAGLLSRHPVLGHRQKIDYFLTDAARRRWPREAERFMDELRSIHLDRQPPAKDGVLPELDATYQRLRDKPDDATASLLIRRVR